MPICINCGSQVPDGGMFCPNCGAQLADDYANQDAEDLTKSFERELSIPEKEASELNSKFQLKMLNPPCPFCGAPFTQPLEPEEKVTCPHCRNSFLVEDSASRAIGDVLKENQKFPEQTVQKAQTIVRNHMMSRRMIHRSRLFEVIDRFRRKGATSPERAMTTEELGLPPAFRRAMNRRLGRTGIIIEVNGKYYLSEKRLEEIKEQIPARRRFRRW